MKVLLAPSNIANQAWLQAEALRRRGHEAQMWTMGASTFGYPTDRELPVPADPGSALRLFATAVAENFDLVHLHYARSLVPTSSALGELWDLPLWRASGARVVMSFHGSDIRNTQHEMDLDPWSYYHFGAKGGDPADIETRLRVIRATVDVMTISSPSNLAHVPDAHYLPLAVDTDALKPGPPPTRAVPVIAHVPSHRLTKGTALILDALDTLKAEGVEFELDLIEHTDNADAVARVARADIVIEKILGDGYGVTALEACALGRALVTRVTPRSTIVSGEIPCMVAQPDTVTDVVRRLIQSPELRRDLGARARDFAVARHSLGVVGAELERLYALGPDIVRPALPDSSEDEGAGDAVLRAERARLLEALEQTRSELAAERRQRREIEESRLPSRLRRLLRRPRRVLGRLRRSLGRLRHSRERSGRRGDQG